MDPSSKAIFASSSVVRTFDILSNYFFASLHRIPKVLTTDELAKITLMFGSSHAKTTRCDYVSQMSKYMVSS